MISGFISASDYLYAQQLHRATTVRWYYAACAVAFAASVFIFFFYQNRLGFIVSCGVVGAVISELLMSRLYLPWKIRRLHRQQKDLASPFTYTWDREFLEAKGANGQSKRPWSHYAKCKENEYLFLLYHSDVLFEMLPKSWFQDQSQITEFQSLTHRIGKT